MNDHRRTNEELPEEFQKFQQQYFELSASHEKDMAVLRAAEEKLKLSEERQREVLENSLDAVYKRDFRTNGYEYISPVFIHLTGYTPEEMKTLPLETVIELIHPDDVPEVEQTLTRAISKETGQANQVEYRFRHKNGGYRWFIDRFTVVYDNQNKPVALIGSISDITERKQAEGALAETQLFLNSIIEYSPNSMWIFDEHGTLIRLNQACRDNLHLKDDEVIGKYNIFEDNLIEEQGFIPMVKDVFKKGLTARFTIQYDTSALKNLKLERTIKVFLDVHISPILNPQGKVTHAVIQHNDITDRKLAEQTLTESVEKYRALLEGSILGILAFDIETFECSFSNSAACKLFGYNEQEITALKLADFHPKESFELVISEFWAQGRGEKSISNALPCLRKDGTIFYADIAGSSTILNGRNCSIGFIMDVTERKKVQESLMESESSLRQAQEIAMMGSWELDLINQKAKWSENCFILYGLKPFELEPTFEYFKNRVHPDDLHIIDETFENIFKFKKPSKGEVRIIFPDGNDRWAQINIAPVVTAGELVALKGIQIDITDIKKAEDKIREKDIQFRKLSSNLPDLIFQFSRRPDGTYCVPIASEGIKNIFGCSPEDVVDDFEPIGKVIFPEDVERVINDIEYSAKHLTYFTCEFRVQIPGKPVQWIFSRSTPEKLPDGTVTWYGFNADITELKQTETELVKAKEHAEESDRLKSAFLANMSHEIRTPMNGILGFSGLLREPQLTGDEQQKYISLIEKSGKRMLNIINDIVNISKIESGLMEISINEVNVNEQVADVLAFFTPEIKKKGIQLLASKALPLKEAIISSDGEKLYAILTNIVNNAIKHTQTGSIEIGVEKKGGFLEFFVKDTGNGIPENQREIIFERFRQSSDLTSRFTEGAGLGLSISKGFVEILGGKIWLESELGKGSVFYFTIPVNADVKAKPSVIKGAASTEADQQVKNLKILIAEDDEDSAWFLDTALKPYCGEIFTAGTGVEAVESLRKHPDMSLIMMDIRMPGMDGYSATRQIRQFNKDVIIFAQTAFAMTGDREKAIEAGCNDYLSKPFRIEELRRLMQQYFSK